MFREVLPDLARLVQSNLRNPLIWQTLAGALAKEGDLVHARQAYAGPGS